MIVGGPDSDSDGVIQDEVFSSSRRPAAANTTTTAEQRPSARRRKGKPIRIPKASNVNNDDADSMLDIHHSHDDDTPTLPPPVADAMDDGEGNGDDDDDEGMIDCTNACSQPLSSEVIHNMTPKYHPPSTPLPSTELGEAMSSNGAKSSSSSSGLWDWDSFGVQKCPKTNKPKQKIADMNKYVRRSKRQSEDTIESSPDDDDYYHRNHNMENNTASYPNQQLQQQRSQPSNPVTSKSTTTTTATARGRQKKDPAQRNDIDRTQKTCDNWLAKSRRQGGLIDETYSDKDDAEFEFDDEYHKSSSK
jgi:hypothetical protein